MSGFCCMNTLTFASTTCGSNAHPANVTWRLRGRRARSQQRRTRRAPAPARRRDVFSSCRRETDVRGACGSSSLLGSVIASILDGAAGEPLHDQALERESKRQAAESQRARRSLAIKVRSVVTSVANPATTTGMVFDADRAGEDNGKQIVVPCRHEGEHRGSDQTRRRSRKQHRARTSAHQLHPSTSAASSSERGIAWK